jgi:N-acetylmuramoyl-L-alanine amidase
MSKKILDAAVVVTFCICLSITSNVEEKCVEGNVIPENNLVAAGVSQILFQNSFTTESDEDTSIERKQIDVVAAQEESAEPQQIDTTEETTVETAEEKTEETTEIIKEADTTKEIQTINEAETIESMQKAGEANRWGISLTEAEIDLLARIVWLEARGESSLGQQAVVEVVFNRMASEIYPNTLYDVLSQKNPVQFCSWKNRDCAMPTEKEYKSVYQVMNGNTSILRSDTLYFSRVALTGNLDVRIGEHSFCY